LQRIDPDLAAVSAANPQPELRHLLSGRVLTRSAIWNLAGGIAPLAVAVLTIPVILRGLGLDRFGVLTLAWALIGYFSLFDFGIGRALTQAVARVLATGPEHDLPTTVWSGLAVMSVVGLIGGGVCIAVVPTALEHVLRIPTSLRGETLGAAYIASAIVPVVIVTAGLRGVLEAQQKFGFSNLVRIPLGVMTYVAPLVVLPFTRNLAAVLAALAVTRVVALFGYFFICLGSNRALRHVAVSAASVRRLIAFGGWISVSNFVSPIMVYMDRFVIAAIMPIAIVAYYTTPFEAVTRLFVVSSAVGGVLYPAFATSYAHDRQRAAALSSRGSKYLFVALFPVLLASVVFAKELLGIWIDPRFAEQAAPVLAWLSVGVLANSLAQVPYGLVQGSGRPDWTAKLHLTELPLYVVTLILLVTYAGIAGAAFAWAVRTSVDYFILDLMSYRLLRPASHWAWWRLLGPAGVLVLAGASVFHGPTWERALMFGAVIAVFIVIAWFTLLPEERAMVRLIQRAGFFGPPPTRQT
jgi:O-antigen/teichoic acid export membrane protein